MTQNTQTSSLLDVFHQIDLEPVRGDGVWLEATDGRRYLDFYGGHAVALLGYNHPRLVATLDSEARRLFFQTNAVPLDIRERAGEALLRFAPKGFTKVFLVNSGAEANENALRTAFLAHPGRKRVVAVKGAFHGRTAAVSALTDGSEKWYAFPARPFEVTWVGFDDEAALATAISDDVAAVIVEPVQGLAGAKALSRPFLEAMRKHSSEHGAVLIFDEVQCGMGRTGWPFAAQHHGVTPDILTTAKGLAGGFPAAAMLVGDALAARVKKGDLGTTFGAGPMACALIEAVITTIESEDLLPRVRRLSAMMRERCIRGPVESVQGLGYLLGLRTRIPAKQVLAGLRERGILAGGANDPNVVRLLPSLILEESHVAQLVLALGDIRS
jgi:acetylornithine/N-succinyldiaminopimelate aminotransferase